MLTLREEGKSENNKSILIVIVRVVREKDNPFQSLKNTKKNGIIYLLFILNLFILTLFFFFFLFSIVLDNPNFEDIFRQNVSDNEGYEEEHIERREEEETEEEETEGEWEDEESDVEWEDIDESDEDSEEDEDEDSEEDSEEDENEDEDEEDIGGLPLYNGASITVRETCLLLLNFQVSNKLFNSHLEQILYSLKHFILPSSNILPSSKNKLLKILKVPQVHKREIHVCRNDCMSFPKRDRKEWDINEACTICGSKRFTGKGRNMRPVKKFIPLEVIPQILKQSNSEEYIEGIMLLKEEIEKGMNPFQGFWGGKLISKFRKKGKALRNFLRSLSLSVGIDGVQWDKSKKPKSVYPIGIKNWNLHPKFRNLRKYLILYTIIPGNFLV